jgi:hypothetical protein
MIKPSLVSIIVMYTMKMQIQDYQLSGYLHINKGFRLASNILNGKRTSIFFKLDVLSPWLV